MAGLLLVKLLLLSLLRQLQNLLLLLLRLVLRLQPLLLVFGGMVNTLPACVQLLGLGEQATRLLLQLLSCLSGG